MAVLSENDRLRVWRGIMRYASRAGMTLDSMTKADLKAAVDATDTWVDNNTAAFNSALPLPFRTTATPDQKTLLLVGVVLMRHNLEFLKNILGEVD